MSVEKLINQLNEFWSEKDILDLLKQIRREDAREVLQDCIAGNLALLNQEPHLTFWYGDVEQHKFDPIYHVEAITWYDPINKQYKSTITVMQIRE